MYNFLFDSEVAYLVHHNAMVNKILITSVDAKKYYTELQLQSP